MDKIIVICGPTSAGKTTLAIKLSKTINGEIVSADSRQVYKYMDIGTGKVPINKNKKDCVTSRGNWVIDNIPVHMYDVISPNEHFSVYDYAIKTQEIIKDIKARNKTPIIVGGTGFYIDVLTGKTVLSNTPPNLEIRKILEGKSLVELQDILREKNPNKYENIDKNNKVRLIRAIEIARNVNNPSEQKKFKQSNDAFLLIGLTAPRSFLYSKVDNWTEKIFDNGIVMETKSLIDRGYKNSPPMKGLVYKTVLEFLEEKETLEKAKQKIKYDLHGYIRRQLTWFNRNLDIKWFNVAEKDFDIEVLKTVQSFIDAS